MQVVSKRSFQSGWYSGKEMWLNLRLLGLEEVSKREKTVYQLACFGLQVIKKPTQNSFGNKNAYDI